MGCLCKNKPQDSDFLLISKNDFVRRTTRGRESLLEKSIKDLKEEKGLSNPFTKENKISPDGFKIVFLPSEQDEGISPPRGTKIKKMASKNRQKPVGFTDLSEFNQISNKL